MSSRQLLTRGAESLIRIKPNEERNSATAQCDSFTSDYKQKLNVSHTHICLLQLQFSLLPVTAQ